MPVRSAAHLWDKTRIIQIINIKINEIIKFFRQGSSELKTLLSFLLPQTKLTSSISEDEPYLIFHSFQFSFLALKKAFYFCKDLEVMSFVTFCNLNISLKLLKTDRIKTWLRRNKNSLGSNLLEKDVFILSNTVYGKLRMLTSQLAFLSSGLMTGTQSLLQPPFCWFPSKYFLVPSYAVLNLLYLPVIT